MNKIFAWCPKCKHNSHCYKKTSNTLGSACNASFNSRKRYWNTFYAMLLQFHECVSVSGDSKVHKQLSKFKLHQIYIKVILIVSRNWGTIPNFLPTLPNYLFVFLHSKE